MKQEYNRTMEQIRLSPEGEARIQRALTGGETGNRRPAGSPMCRPRWTARRTGTTA